MRGNPWWTLAGSSLGLFVLMLDSTVVNVALPDIRRSLGLSVEGLQWVANAYLLVLASFVVTAGRLGDVLGRRAVFLAGMALFGAGSLLAGLAGGAEALLAGRVLQGLGGAALISLSLALVTGAFPEAERGRAVGIWAGVSAIALGLGPLLGGAIVEAASWRWVFLVNLPVVAAGAAIVALATPESRDPSAPRRIDARGLVLLAVGLGSLVLGIVQGRGWGWDSAATLGAFALAALALTALVVVERRVPAPIVDLSLFRNGPYFGASAAAFTLVGSYWTIIFLQPQTMQSGLGFSALEAGALVLPLTAPMVVLSPLGGRLTARFGARGLMTFGMALATAGCLWLTQVDAAADAWDVVPGSLLFGVALGLVYAPMSTAAMVALPAAKAGIAAGVLAMVRVLAGALFLAIGGALFARALLDDAGAGPPEAYAEALGSAMWLPALLCGAGTVLTWCFVRGAADEATASGGAHHHRRHRFHF